METTAVVELNLKSHATYIKWAKEFSIALLADFLENIAVKLRHFVPLEA